MSERRPLVHGTRHGYKAWRCRCADCRAANNAYTEAWKASLSPAGYCPVCDVDTQNLFRHEDRHHRRRSEAL